MVELLIARYKLKCTLLFEVQANCYFLQTKKKIFNFYNVKLKEANDLIWEAESCKYLDVLFY